MSKTWIEKLKKFGADEHDIEDYEERAAIMEYDGRLSKKDAERKAYGIISKELYNRNRNRKSD